MKRAKYSEFTKEEKDLMQEIWVKVLNTFCPADAIGNRPCDNGCPCDMCHYDSGLQSRYAQELKKVNMEVIED